MELFERRLHPHHGGAPHPLGPGAVAQAGRDRRDLSRHLCGLVRGARRGLLRRGRTGRRPGRPEDGAVGRPGRMGRGAELLLPPVGLAGPAVEALRGAAGRDPARQPAQRGGQLREERAARSLGQPHQLLLGRAGAGRSRPHHVRLARRADQLHHRGRLSGRGRRGFPQPSGRPTFTWWARTSCASTRSTGRPS